MNEETRAHYEVRIRVALEHLEKHLHRRVSLKELARVSAFAPCHFHRIFKSMIGETAADYAKRRRLEKAAFIIKHGDRTRSLTVLAHDLGFSESADFSRAFKAHFGMSPSAYRRTPTPLTLRETPWKIPKLKDNPDGFSVQLSREGPQRFAYFRVHGSYNPERQMVGVNAMKAWMKDQGIEAPLIGMSEDDPDIVALDKCRYDWCVSVSDEVKSKGRIGVRVLEGGPIARMRVNGDMNKCSRAWDWLFECWLPQSGHEPRNAPAREVWLDAGEKIKGEYEFLYVLPVRACNA